MLELRLLEHQEILGILKFLNRYKLAAEIRCVSTTRSTNSLNILYTAGCERGGIYIVPRMILHFPVETITNNGSMSFVVTISELCIYFLTPINTLCPNLHVLLL